MKPVEGKLCVPLDIDRPSSQKDLSAQRGLYSIRTGFIAWQATIKKIGMKDFSKIFIFIKLLSGLCYCYSKISLK